MNHEFKDWERFVKNERNRKLVLGTTVRLCIRGHDHAYVFFRMFYCVEVY